MIKVQFFFILLCMVGCSTSNCIKGSLYTRLEKVLIDGKLVLQKDNQAQFKKDLLRNICNHSVRNKSVILIEEIGLFERYRYGAIYFYDEMKILYYSSKNGAATFDEENPKDYYEPIIKVLEYVKGDFVKSAENLKRKFEKIELSDSPTLKMTLIDTTFENDIVYTFLFSPNLMVRPN